MSHAALDRICNLSLFLVQHDEVNPEAMRYITKTIATLKSKETLPSPLFTSHEKPLDTLLSLAESIDLYINDKNTCPDQLFEKAQALHLNASLCRCLEVACDLQKPPLPKDTQHELSQKLKDSLFHHLQQQGYTTKLIHTALQHPHLEYKELTTYIRFLSTELHENRLEELQHLLHLCKGTSTLIDDHKDKLERIERAFERDRSKITNLAQSESYNRASQKFLSCIRHPLNDLFKNYPQGLQHTTLSALAEYYTETIFDLGPYPQDDY